MSDVTMYSYFSSMRNYSHRWWLGDTKPHTCCPYTRSFFRVDEMYSLLAALGSCAYAYERKAAASAGLEHANARTISYAIWKPDILEKFYALRSKSYDLVRLSNAVAITLPDIELTACLCGEVAKYDIDNLMQTLSPSMLNTWKDRESDDFLFPKGVSSSTINTGTTELKPFEFSNTRHDTVVLRPTVDDPALKALRSYIIERTRVCATGVLLFALTVALVRQARTVKQLAKLVPELEFNVPGQRSGPSRSDTTKVPSVFLKHAWEHEVKRVTDKLRHWIVTGNLMSLKVPYGGASRFLTSVVASGLKKFVATDTELKELAGFPVSSMENQDATETLYQFAVKNKFLKDFCNDF